MKILALHHLTKANSKQAHAYIQKYGSVEEALQSAPELIHWKECRNWQEELELILKREITLITYFDQTYPASLKTLADPPLLLYVRGKIEEAQKAIAIVGTRGSSYYGLEMAEKFGFELAAKGITVISGLARGIDSKAHQGALNGGKTLAVLGSGLFHLYPKENQSLAEEISNKGALISEYPLTQHPEKHFFPQRNRLVSALSQAALLIEAPLKSGAMITMNLAFNQNKPCFAIPGPIDRNSFQGNHFLLKSQKAQLVENSLDVLSLLDPKTASFKNSHTNANRLFLEREEEKLLTLLPEEEVCLEEIALRTSLPIAQLNSLLMSLVLKKAVRAYPGKFYKKAYNP